MPSYFSCSSYSILKRSLVFKRQFYSETISKNQLNQPHMVAEKNVSDGPESGPQREETAPGMFVNQLQQEFGSKMLHAPRSR